MSGQYPTSPGFSTVNLTSNHSTLSSTAQSGKRQVRQLGGHRWSFTAKYDELTRDQFMPVFAFSLAQRGRFESFTIVPPDLATPRGVVTGAPLVSGASQTGNTLNIDGCTVSITGWGKAGDVFTVAGSTKVHMLTADADTDVAGAVTLNFEPDLIISPADNAILTFTNVAFTMAFNNDIQQYNVAAPRRYTYEIDLIEVL